MGTRRARVAVVGRLAAVCALVGLGAGCTGGVAAPAPPPVGAPPAPPAVSTAAPSDPPAAPPAAPPVAVGPAPDASPAAPATRPETTAEPAPPAVPPAPTGPVEPPSRETLVVVSAAGVPSLDREAFGTPAQQEVLANVLEPLVRLVPRARRGGGDAAAPRLAPGLCRSVELLPAGVRCRLGDARSAAGNEVTSADVEWTLGYTLAAKGPGALALGLAGVDLARPVTVEDPKTFTINAASPTSALAPALALVWFSPLDSVEVRRHATEADPFAREWLASHSAGFGPYRVDAFDPGRQVDLSASPGYRGTRGFPPAAIPRVVHRAVPDAETRAGLLAAGQAQLARAAEPDVVRALDGSPTVTVERLPFNAQIVLFLDTATPPFDDPSVRRAIACAVDKGAFVRAVSYGQYAVANGITSVAKLPSQAEEGAEPCPRRDLERARRLLARAGGWDGVVPLAYTEPDSGPNAAAGARVIARDLAEAGIVVEATPADDPARFFGDALQGELPLFLLAWGSNVPDAGASLSAWFRGTSPLNLSRFASPAADAALAAALALPLGAPGRDELLRRFQRIYVSSAAAVPLATLSNQVVAHRSLCGVRADPVDVVRWQLLSYC